MLRGQDINFVGGLNTDDDVRYLSNGDYRYAKYFRNMSPQSQNAGDGESVSGNVIVDNPDMPSGTNIIVGSAKWVERNSIVYLVWNSDSNNTIWSLDSTTNEITLVMSNLDNAGYGIPNVGGTALNFNLQYKSYHANVIDNMLYWTDGYNPPRKLDLLKAIEYISSLGNSEDGYSFLCFNDLSNSSKTMDVLKAPPLNIITAEYDTNNTRNYNKLYGNQYQFRYQYVYENNEESKWSMISDQPFPPSQEFISGRDVRDSLKYNIINLTYYSGPYNVSKINFAFRRSEIGQWLIFKELDLKLESVSNNAFLNLVFDDNTAPKGASLTDVLYDNVPQVAFCQEALPAEEGGSILSYGNFISDYDLVQDLDVQAERVLNELYDVSSIELPTISISHDNSASVVIAIDYTCHYDQLSPSETVSPTFPYLEGDVLVFNLFSDDAGESSQRNYYYTVTYEDVYNDPLDLKTNNELINDLLANMLTKLSTDYPDVPWVIYENPNDTSNNAGLRVLNWSAPGLNGVNDVVYATVLRKNRSIKSLKKGSKKVFGIQYYDRGNRSNTVQTLPEMILDIPLPGLESGRADFQYNIDPQGYYGSQSAYTVSSKFTINSLPPSWATHYSILVKKDEMISSFMQTTITALSTTPSNPFVLTLQLDKKPNSTSIDYYTSSYKGATFYHTPSKGDRLRFITMEVSKAPYPYNTPPIPVNNSLFLPNPYLQTYCEVEVLSYDIESNTIQVNDFDIRKIVGNISNSVGCLVEIYTPKKDIAEDVWFEVEKGDIYEDETTGTKYHSGNTQSQTDSLPAIVSCDYGDVYYRLRDLATGIYLKSYDNYDAMVADSGSRLLNVWSYLGVSLLPTALNTYYYDGLDYVLMYNDMQSYQLPNITNRTYFIEDYNYSDYYKSDSHGLGRIGVENSKTKQTHYKTGIIHSGNYIAGSYINGLSSFDSLGNAVYLDDTFGPINRLKMIGYTLKALQNRKETSVYIQKSFAVSADSGTTAFTSKVFGGINPYDSLFGCIHPGSVQVVDNDMYYYDFFTGAFVRSSSNGQVQITEGKYKFAYWATSKANSIQMREVKQFFGKNYVAKYEPVSMVDDINSEYSVNFVKWWYPEKDTGNIPKAIYDSNEGVVFNYSHDRWVYFVDYPLTWCESLGVIPVQFKDGNIYLCNQSFLEDGTPNELTFFGEQYDMEVEFVMNENPIIIKRPLSIGVRSKFKMDLTDVKTIGNSSYPEMKSKLYPNNFKLKEGYFWAAYLRDMTNIIPFKPNQDTEEKALMNGRELRGYAVINKLSYTGNEKNILFDVKCFYVPSEAMI